MIDAVGRDVQVPRMRCCVRLLPAVFALVILAMGVTVWTLQEDARAQIEEMGTAATDSTQWFLAQSEVEALALQRAILLMEVDTTGDPALARDLRRRFDIFYPRIQTLRSGRTYQRLRNEPGMAEALAGLQAMLDAQIPAIDGDDATLRAALPVMGAAMGPGIAQIRHVSLEGGRIFADKSAERREGVARAMATLSLLVVPLFLVLALSVVILSLMVRAADTRNRRIAAVGSRMQSLFEASIDAILVARPDGRILGFNAAAQRIYGYSPAEAMGSDMVDLLTPRDQRAAVRALLAEVRDRRARPRDGGPDIIQATARHKSGRIIPVEVSISVAEGEDGPLLVGFVRDVSRRAAEEAEMIEARDRAVAGEQAKTRMIAVMSHEMRTPLNGILGLLDLLSLTPLDDRQRQYLQAMEHSGRMLLGHVNDVLDTSRARGGRLVLAAAPVDLRAVVAAAVDGLQAQARAAGNCLTLDCQGADQGLVVGDAARLEQIVVNLVGNAIKFTENGTIRVDLDRTGPPGQIELRVTDSGIGIPEEDLGRIFDEFVTLGSTFDRKVEGTGLGLSIVKGLVDAMGGEIDVASEPGQGTAFRVGLHLPPAKAQPQRPDLPAPAPVASGDLKVLLVEDNAINRLVAREMLRRQGCHVLEAEDGLVGVQMAQDERFDLILMDISMPRLNGIDAARQIRAEGANRHSPIVALTAHAMPEDLARFREAGMDRALVKPLSRADLVSMIEGLRPAPPADDLDALIVASGRDPGSLRQRIVAELREGLDQLSDGGGAALAHRLAGSAAVLGLAEMHQGLIALERDLTAGCASGQIAADLRKFRQMLDSYAPETVVPEAEPRRQAGAGP